MNQDDKTRSDGSFTITGNTVIDGATWLALFSIAAYYCLYSYERGYASYFGIPEEVVSFDLKKLWYGPVVFFVLYGLVRIPLSILDLILRQFRIKEVPVREAAYLAYVVVIGSLLYWANRNIWAAGAVVLIVVLSLVFIVRGKRARRQDADLVNEDEGPLVSLTSKLFGAKFLLILVLLWAGSIIFHLVGQGVARDRSEFLQITVGTNERESYTMLSSDGDQYVCVKRNTDSTFLPIYYMLDREFLSSRLDVTFYTVRLASLRPIIQLDSELSVKDDAAAEPDLVMKKDSVQMFEIENRAIADSGGKK